MLCNAFNHARSRCCRVYATHGQAVKTNDRILAATDICLCAIGFLIDQRKAVQKLIQCCLTAVEGIDSV